MSSDQDEVVTQKIRGVEVPGRKVIEELRTLAQRIDNAVATHARDAEWRRICELLRAHRGEIKKLTAAIEEFVREE